jgi:hypothetical protein
VTLDEILGCFEAEFGDVDLNFGDGKWWCIVEVLNDEVQASGDNPYSVASLVLNLARKHNQKVQP